MALSILLKVLSDVPLTLVSVKGNISVKDPIQAIDRIYHHPEFDPNINVLFDFRNAKLELNQDELKNTAGQFLDHPAYRGERM
ncbi:MAG: hypothetical protein HKO96_10535 [Flavobacteriaceae bacterium]|nr:hypothetical protein [Bacteroidia bacterium]NNK70902.1 hypothetical protein [Flavobacteriaceae bacterium]